MMMQQHKPCMHQIQPALALVKHSCFPCTSHNLCSLEITKVYKYTGTVQPTRPAPLPARRFSLLLQQPVILSVHTTPTPPSARHVAVSLLGQLAVSLNSDGLVAMALSSCSWFPSMPAGVHQVAGHDSALRDRG